MVKGEEGRERGKSASPIKGAMVLPLNPSPFTLNWYI
jgi:hypothetical protein